MDAGNIGPTALKDVISSRKPSEQGASLISGTSVMERSSIKIFAATLVALASTGCSLALMAPIVVEGQAFPAERANELRAGMTASQAQGVLGAPLRQRTLAGTTVWNYQMRRRLKECRFYVGPLPLQRARTTSYDLEIVFDTAGLESAVYHEQGPDLKTERILVGRPNNTGRPFSTRR